MVDHSVWTFFYGSYMNRAVVAEVEIALPERRAGRVAGFDIQIRPRANLVRSDRHVAYGILAQLTHPELARLYTHAHEVLGERYLPEAVLVDTLDGRFQPALCYLCPAMDPRPGDPAYVERVAAPARELGFPAWYVERIERFGAPGAG